MLLLLLLVLVTYLLALTRCDIFCATTQTTSSTTNTNTNNGFFVAVDAFLPASSSFSSSSPFLLRQHSSLSSTPKVKEAMHVDVNAEDDAQQQQRQQLPDFGKTTVEVDTIKLEKKTRARRRTKPEPAEDDAEEDVSAKWIRQDLFGSSLVDQTMEELQNDQDYLATQERIQKVGLVGITNEERKQRRRALTNLGIEPFGKFLATALHQQQSPSIPEHETDDPPSSAAAARQTTAPHLPPTTRTTPYRLQRKEPKILQINIGLYCNQACSHCHVESSPMRTSEMMTTDTVVQCLELLKATPSITTLDITGGAPELNANFRYLVSTARAVRGPDLIIIDRCNLTVLQEPGQDDLVEFLQRHRVHIIASLPCYSADNVDTQRGGGVFERSIAGLLALNRAGYGHPSTSTTQQDDEDKDGDDGDGGAPLLLDLVYNPLGGFLPPPQEKLQAQYKTQLHDNFGILFNSLYTITNMPIKRFADFLHRRDELEDYMALLVRNFNPDTVSELMCLDTINIGWDGKVRTIKGEETG